VFSLNVSRSYSLFLVFLLWSRYQTAFSEQPILLQMVSDWQPSAPGLSISQQCFEFKDHCDKNDLPFSALLCWGIRGAICHKNTSEDVARLTQSESIAVQSSCNDCVLDVISGINFVTQVTICLVFHNFHTNVWLV
jgi:hypothetical protein